jgi:hypothetical protein
MMAPPWDKYPLIEIIYLMSDSVVQVPGQLTLHEIFKPGGFTSLGKEPPPIAASR